MSETLKSTCEEVFFFAELMLEAYNFPKNELLYIHFSAEFCLYSRYLLLASRIPKEPNIQGMSL